MNTTEPIGNGICEKCPFATMLDAAETVVQNISERSPEALTEAERALGGIAVTRVCLEEVASRQICMQPQMSMNQEPKCPLFDMTMTSRTFALAPWRSDQFAVKLERLGTKDEDGGSPTGHGTYL